jgi:phospholipase/carboxylesterase
MKWSKIAGLDVIEVEAPENSEAIVILHGYGADAKDLAPLAGELALSPPRHWYFLNAPLKLDGPVMIEGRMWFPIDMMELQMSQQQGRPRDFLNKKIPEGFESSMKMVHEFLEKISSHHEKITLGGFSQGAMVASLAALRSKAPITKLLLFSTTFAAENLWEKAFEERNFDFKVFQSHGTQDPVLPVSEAQRLASYLKEKGVDHEYHEFSGGHEISYEIINKATEFLNQGHS